MTLRAMSPLEKRSRTARLNAERRTAGLCTWCGEPAAPRKVMCQVHLDAVAKRDRDRRQRERETSERLIRRARQ